MSVPKRRWSYSLGTLFMVVTVAGCWLGYELNWIRQRESALAIPGVTHVDARLTKEAGLDAPRAPWSLALLGEQGYKRILVPLVPEATWLRSAIKFNPHVPELGGLEPLLTASDQAELRRIQRLFPEAEVWPFIK